MNMVRSMLSGKKLPKIFWPEAVNWTVHILGVVSNHQWPTSKFSEESKAYRLYDLVSKRIIVSRDVVFDEEASWDWEKSHKESVLMNLDWGENETLPDAITLAGNRRGL
ncbi:hypothetical protein Tco_1324923, partial [Tanacetum coccineum]